MTDDLHREVRPTKRALSDLGRSFPPLTSPLSELDHPLIVKAQSLPAEAASGGLERIRDLDDQVWFKVKINHYRGVSGVVDWKSGAEDQPSEEIWWLVAGGERNGDKSSDFYVQLAAECLRKGKGTGTTSSTHLNPSAIDYTRLTAERATLAVESMKRIVREAIAKSTHDGKLWRAMVPGYSIGALVRSKDGDSYLAITADGYYDPKLIAVILSSVPGIEYSDWGAEPGGVLEIGVDEGQIVFSTMIPPATLACVLDEFDLGFL